MLHRSFPLQHHAFRTPGILAFVLVPVLATVFLYDLDPSGNFHGDETLWLAVSNKMFRLYAVDGNLRDPAWYQEYSTFGSRQPQIGKYVIGIGTFLNGSTAEPYKPYYYNWQHDLAWNLTHQGVPPAEQVVAGRIPVALSGIVACLVFFWLSTMLLGTWPGLLAVTILLAGKLLIDSSRVAMIDTPALAFSLMSVVGLVYVLRALRTYLPRRALWYALPTGIAAGFAIGTKLNALLVLITLIVMLLSEAIIHFPVRWKISIAALVACAIICSSSWAIFYASNPFLYGNAIAGARHMFEMSSLVATIPFDQLTSRAQQVGAIWDQLLIYAPLARLGFSHDRWLIVWGAVLLLTMTLQHGADLRRYQLDLVLVWTIITYVGTTLWLPHPWARYFLPPQPCNALLETIAVAWSVRGLWRLMRMLWQRSAVL